MAENDELLPIVDTAGNIIGSACRCICHDGQSMLLHPVCHLHIFNGEGALLMQLRSKNKRVQPGKWDTAVGGHVDFGESIHGALSREAKEEAGFDVYQTDIDQLDCYIYKSSVERELICCFAAIAPCTYRPEVSEPDDIDEFRFWSMNEIHNNLGKNIFTPNFEEEFLRIVEPYIKTKRTNCR